MNNVIPFTITATNLNLADTTEQTLVTFKSNNMVRIPTRLELKKAAGTAYTITDLGINSKRYVVGDSPDSYSDMFQDGAFLEVISVAREDAASRSQGLAFFYVPLVGFLDQATAQSRLALPSVRPRVFQAGAVSMKLRLTVPVASGTGSLQGRLYYDEYSLGGF